MYDQVYWLFPKKKFRSCQGEIIWLLLIRKSLQPEQSSVKNSLLSMMTCLCLMKGENLLRPPPHLRLLA
jgi:hypothetical protein